METSFQNQRGALLVLSIDRNLVVRSGQCLFSPEPQARVQSQYCVVCGYGLNDASVSTTSCCFARTQSTNRNSLLLNKTRQRAAMPCF